MKKINSFNDLDILITNFMSRWGITLLRYSLGVIYIWFGILKPFGLSPAQELVENFYLVPTIMSKYIIILSKLIN